MYKRRASVLLTVGLALVGCSGTHAGSSPASDESTSGTLTSSVTLAQADAHLHDLLAGVMAVNAPKREGTVIGGLLPPDSSAPACVSSGTAPDQVNVSFLAPPGAEDITRSVRDSLASKGWTFRPWQPLPHLYAQESTATLGEYSLKIRSDLVTHSVDLVAETPCLPGSPTTHPSMFPTEPAPPN